MGKMEERLYATTDAQVWAEEFMKVVKDMPPGQEVDHGFMIGWFANAMETAKNHTRRLNDEEFRMLLDLWMVNDPWPLDNEANDRFTQMLRNEAVMRGHESVVESYHYHMKET